MPTQKSSSTTKKQGQRALLKLVFFYILAFATLYVSIVSYLNLLFDYINWKFPDPAQLSYSMTSTLNAIRLATSILVVVWALHIFTQWLIAKDLKNYSSQPEKSGHKLLTYLTLLLATITIAVDLIILIYNFYSGGFTTPFLLKICSIFVVAAVVFGYYRWDLKEKFGSKTKIRKITGWVTSGVLVASIVLGFFIVGSPAKQRDIRFDEKRITDLQEIQGQVVMYWQKKDELPKTLEDLGKNISGYQAPSDPQTQAAYKYTLKTNLSFELCATFTTDGTSLGIYGNKSVPVTSYDSSSTNWDHKTGETCFTRTIDPKLDSTDILPSVK
jgi:hypothetical protein